jgi:hypothetical protein
MAANSREKQGNQIHTTDHFENTQHESRSNTKYKVGWILSFMMICPTLIESLPASTLHSKASKPSCHIFPPISLTPKTPEANAASNVLLRICIHTQAVPLGLALALAFSFFSSFNFFFFSSFFSSFFRLRLLISSSVLGIGLKNPSNLAC